MGGFRPLNQRQSASADGWVGRLSSMRVCLQAANPADQSCAAQGARNRIWQGLFRLPDEAGQICAPESASDHDLKFDRQRGGIAHRWAYRNGKVCWLRRWRRIPPGEQYGLSCPRRISSA
jgi:hypothetical protein